MLWKHAAQGDERAYMTIKNVTGATLSTGLGVGICTNTASFNGTNAIVSSNTLGTSTFVGVAFQDIANNATAAIQTYGFAASVLLSGVGTSITINSGDPLVPAAAGFFSAAPTYAVSGFKYLVASNVPAAVSASAYASGWIRGVL